MRRLAHTCAAAALLASATYAPANAKIYALVIGIDEYDHIPSLAGAVNDADDITGALEELGAEVTTLLNRDASRQAIFDAWADKAAQVGPGDLLIVSYAGHGSNEPEFWEGNETDGRDETLLLSGFEPSGFGSGERVRDDEIAQLIALTPADQTVFVADACHAGTLSRSVAPILGYRYYAAGELVDDPLPPPPPNTSPDEGRGELGLFLAAVDESAKVPEFLIDGKPRGALSHAFASALRGEADHDGDRQLTLGEIETFVRRSIRNISYGLQMPEITRGGGVADVLLALETGPRAAKASSEGNEADTGPDVEGAAPSIWQTPFASLPQPALATTGDAIDGLEGATIVSETRNADLVLNAQSGTLTSMVGDAVAEVPGSTASLLQPTIDKTRLSLALTDYAFDMDLDVVFLGGDRTYRKDDIVEVAVSGRTTRHLTLFNLSSTGKINYLYPVRDPAGGIMDPLETSPDSFTLPLTITPPFGAEHIVALETTTMADDIRSTIASYDGSTDIRGFWDQVRRAVDRQPGNVTIAIFPFHSADEGN